MPISSIVDGVSDISVLGKIDQGKLYPEKEATEAGSNPHVAGNRRTIVRPAPLQFAGGVPGDEREVENPGHDKLARIGTRLQESFSIPRNRAEPGWRYRSQIREFGPDFPPNRTYT